MNIVCFFFRLQEERGNKYNFGGRDPPLNSDNLQYSGGESRRQVPATNFNKEDGDQYTETTTQPRGRSKPRFTQPSAPRYNNRQQQYDR